MELLQLQYFLAVARLEHMTEAARNLHVTQSSLSKTIQRLEEDLGVPLFDRVGRKLRLNESGSRFLRRAERALFELEQGKQELSDLSSPEHGTLELAVTTASTLPNILREFRKKRPDIQYHVQMLTTQEMVTLLNRGEVDYCLSSPPIKGDDIECQIVFIDPILVAVPKGHRLANRSSVTLIELRDEWFVGVKSGYGTRDLIDSVCKSVGFVPKYVYEGDEPARLSTLVEAEIGLAFIPSTARNSREDIQYLQVENHELEREIALLWHRSRYISQAALEFREVVVEYFGALSKQTI
ncbi:LysR family transcriptional regulator [Paenibacillus sp. FSL R5-0887]|uniref:LysR family transcriptional regulator n=1 Tax=Paenibacillus TaxID=44249 RepID=UPI00096CDF1F|nr:MULTISPECIES: LysR family transcriptional regulator [Paenibacillus]MDH6425878.1 LysR family transcriptional activator of glutamate synthase operon [Paenibacillus sp. PastH-4]MDH6441899.1 LysR family transcriptional activator of glutamate synthase operon [Paenibacillus sp. PastF-4]MDH6527386.1 LysR family transcriptional activator of glutamate synthase operon [Paenibacillus sp. PastH-3]OMC65183.1 LysR family transcriptional regulator [Paenibacillus odorifer]OMD57123.1 LysR family transcripti